MSLVTVILHYIYVSFFVNCAYLCIAMFLIRCFPTMNRSFRTLKLVSLSTYPISLLKVIFKFEIRSTLMVLLPSGYHLYFIFRENFGNNSSVKIIRKTMKYTLCLNERKLSQIFFHSNKKYRYGGGK